MKRNMQPPPQRIPTVEKKPLFFHLRYLGPMSETVSKDICRKIRSTYPILKPMPIFRTNQLAPTVMKDQVPLCHKPKVIYEFICPCGARYVGKSERCLHIRRAEHVPKWVQNSNSRPKSNKVAQSAVTRHLTECERKSDVLADTEKGFKVLRSLKNRLQLNVAESVTIKLTRQRVKLENYGR